MNFGEKIDNLMIKNNLKYATEFASKIGLSADTVNQYRKKETPEGIEIMKIKRLADFFNVSVDYFLEDDEEDFKIDEFKYIQLINKMEDIQLEDFIKEVKTIIKDNECILKNKEIKYEKKYLLDSLDIGMKLLKKNI